MTKEKQWTRIPISEANRYLRSGEYIVHYRPGARNFKGALQDLPEEYNCAMVMRLDALYEE